MTQALRRHARPAPPLATFIDRYWGWEGVATLPERVLPGTGAECLFHYAEPFLLNGNEPAQATLIAPRSRAVEITARGPVGFVAVRFRSGRLRHLCATPLAALHDGEWPAEKIWGDEAMRLSEILRRASDWQARIAALDAFFLKQLARFHQRASEPFDAVLDLFYYAPATSVERIAEKSGWTRRHFLRKFSDYYGITPKRFSRLARLNHTMRALALDTTTTPLDTALRMGYFDQAHFIHDTQALTGMTPGVIIPGLRDTSHFYNPPSRSIA